MYEGEQYNVLCMAIRRNKVYGLSSTLKPQKAREKRLNKEDMTKDNSKGMSGWNAWSQQILTRKVEGITLLSAHHAGIFGLDGKLWAGSDAFMSNKVNQQSFKKIHESINKGADHVSKFELGDMKYFVLKNDPSLNFVIGKSTQKGAGCTIARAKSCFVVGIYDNDQVQPANNTSQVCYVRDQLMSAGY